jgi:hypothetical protein
MSGAESMQQVCMSPAPLFDMIVGASLFIILIQDEKTSADYYFDSYAHFGKGVPLIGLGTAVVAMLVSPTAAM